MPRHSKKVTRRHKRKTLKGGYYSFNGALATGAPSYGTGSEMGDFAVSRSGNNSVGGSKRKHKKRRGGAEESSSEEEEEMKVAGRRRKMTKRRKTMKGGGKFGAVSASFTGTGERGIGNYSATNTHYPPFGGPAGGAFNNAGAQPGSGFGSFVRM
jgi:hypothetical protein